MPQPSTLASLLDETAESLPALFFLQPYLRISFLTQHVKPSPAIQLAQDFDWAEFGVTHQKNRSSFRQQLAHISQQGQLFPSRTMTPHMFHPGPGDRNRPLAVCQTDNQQLMPKTDLGSIHNQTDLSEVAKLGLQPLPRHWLVPFSDSEWLDFPAIGSGGGSHSSVWLLQKFCQPLCSNTPSGSEKFQPSAKQKLEFEWPADQGAVPESEIPRYDRPC